MTVSSEPRPRTDCEVAWEKYLRETQAARTALREVQKRCRCDSCANLRKSGVVI